MVAARVHDVLPEWDAFVHAVRARRPGDGTWCEAWTVRDVLIHQTGNAEELARVLAAHLAGSPVETRGFDREAPYRAMPAPDLWSAFTAHCERLADVTEAAARDLPPDTDIVWTGRHVNPAFFAEHMREELVLHRWDLTGDDSAAVRALAEPWMTEHSVNQVGLPLLRRGSAALGLDGGGRVEGRLRVPGTDDVVITADADGTGIGFAAPHGPATIESDAAVRTLLLWGRRPADPSRWHSDAGPEALRAVRTLLGGY
ncbi:maleylpyruvate isomerase N-terminal domain-containing protein [Streptacidiphilus griseoplanus]|uniref:maleylpyruvate isomerase N-terminal domain-containing protein n=1 Tax=Peterkaempfera griseoplana TaxID=66896 RepID=UPI0006E2CDA4|nr:maleylpyruvate isomerase N-terminal domain-containing protein [Peterkaempfera griseoplana]